MFLWSSNFLFAWCILQNCLTACKKRSLYSSSSAGVLEAQLGAANKIPQILFAWCVLLLKRTYIHTSSLEKYPIFAKSLHFYQEAGKRRSLNQIWFSFFWMLLHLAENWRMQLIFTFFVVIKNKGKNSAKIVSQGCFWW